MRRNKYPIDWIRIWKNRDRLKRNAEKRFQDRLRLLSAPITSTDTEQDR